MAPVERLGLVVKLIGVAGAEFVERLENAQGGAAAEVGAVQQFAVAVEGHHAASYAYVVGSQAAKFLGQHIFQTLEGFGHHFKSIVHSLCSISTLQN